MRSQLRRALVILEGAALLVGTVFGAGFLILPYTALKAGVWVSVFWLILFAALVSLLHLMYGEIVLATKDAHRLPGYARLYFGKSGARIATLSFVAGVFGGLLVYLLLGGHFLWGLFLSDLGFSKVSSTIIFWVFFTLLIIADLSFSSRVNFAITVVTMGILFGLSLFSVKYFSLSNFSFSPTASPLFPYGIILFSLVGYLAIPEIIRLLKKERAPHTLLRPITMWASLFAALFSGLFMAAILGATGGVTSQDAISGLGALFPPWAVRAGFLLAFLEIATSYLIFGISAKETLQDDFRFSRNLSLAAVSFLPLGLFLFGITNFVKVVGILGSLWVSLDSILIIRIWAKANEKNAEGATFLRLPRWVPTAMLLLFLVAGLASLFFGN